MVSESKLRQWHMCFRQMTWCFAKSYYHFNRRDYNSPKRWGWETRRV